MLCWKTRLPEGRRGPDAWCSRVATLDRTEEGLWAESPYLGPGARILHQKQSWGMDGVSPSQEAPWASTAPCSQWRAGVVRGHAPPRRVAASLPCLLMVLPAPESCGPPASMPFPASPGVIWGEESHKTSGMGAGTHGRCWPGMCPAPGSVCSCSQ